MTPIPLRPEILTSLTPPDPEPFFQIHLENAWPALAVMVPVAIGAWLYAQQYNKLADNYEADRDFQAHQAAIWVENHQTASRRLMGFIGEVFGSGLIGTSLAFVLTNPSSSSGIEGATILPSEAGVPVAIGIGIFILAIAKITDRLPGSNRYKNAAEQMVDREDE